MGAWPDFLGADPDETPDPEDGDLDDELDDGDVECPDCGSLHGIGSRCWCESEAT